MYVFNVAVLFACTLCCCGAAFVDTVYQCSYKDDECLKTLYQKILHDMATPGIPELNIPPVDPLHISNVSVPILDALTITITDGTIKGIKNCVVNSIHIDFDKESGSESFTCDLTVKSHFKMSGSSPTLQGLFGSSDITGDGKAKIKLEKVSINLDFPIYVIKKEDGETYIKLTNKNIKYKYDVGNASFSAEKILIGKNDISALVVTYFNENWKTLLNTTGKVLIDKALEFYFNFFEKVFDKIQTRLYIMEDITSFVKT